MIAVVRYNAGNIRSVVNALDRLGCESIVTDDPEQLKAADKVIFPGVGEAASAMAYLSERKLDQVIKDLKQPVLGICLGLQLMCKHSEEGDTNGLGIFDVEVKRFPAELKVPHMGWNEFTKLDGPLFKNVALTDNVYFVHSYYAALGADTMAVTEHGIEFSSALHKDNFYAVQFHPEKSAAVGQRIIQNFLDL